MAGAACSYPATCAPPNPTPPFRSARAARTPRARAQVTDDPSLFDGAFRPDSVSFYVRTDNGKADAGHFILGAPPPPRVARPRRCLARTLWRPRPRRRVERSQQARRAIPVHQGRPDGPPRHRRHHARRHAVRGQPVVLCRVAIRLGAQVGALLRGPPVPAAAHPLPPRDLRLHRRVRARQPRPLHHVVRLDQVRQGE